MYNSFQLKKVERKMFNDSIIMFICDCIQIIVYNNMECCMYPTCWIAVPHFFLSLKVSDIISGFLFFNILCTIIIYLLTRNGCFVIIDIFKTICLEIY